MINNTIINYINKYGDCYSKYNYQKYNFKKSNYTEIYLSYLLDIIGQTDQAHKKIISLPLVNQFLVEEDKIIGNQDLDYIKYHLSSLYYQLCNKYNIQFIIKELNELNKTTLIQLVEKYDYSNSWKVSNQLMGLGVLLSYNSEITKEFALPEELLIFISSLQCTETGLWHSKKNPSILNSIAGTFHYLPLFCYLNKNIRYSKEIITQLKKIYLGNGYFCSPKGYACIDYDCLFILYCILLQDKKEKCLCDLDRDFILQVANDFIGNINYVESLDCGFSEYGRPDIYSDFFKCVLSFKRHCCTRTLLWNLKKFVRLTLLKNKPIYSNGIKTCGSLPLESNTFAVLFRVFTYELAMDIVYINKYNKSKLKQRYCLPGIGYTVPA
jgi:hypothetical protein